MFLNDWICGDLSADFLCCSISESCCVVYVIISLTGSLLTVAALRMNTSTISSKRPFTSSHLGDSGNHLIK